LRIAVWSPLPPAPSEVADHTADLLPALAEHHEVVAVVEDPATVDREAVSGVPVVGHHSVPVADLDVYQIGNSAAHTFVYRAALQRPGVVVLHEWVLHDLVWLEAEERSDLPGYLREMRRSHGGAGSFVAHQVSRGRGGTILPSLFAVNDRLLESSLGAATLTREAGARLRRRHPRLPHLHLPPHVALPDPSLPARTEARRVLGLPDDALLVTVPGPVGAASGLEALTHAVGQLRGELPSLRLVVAGGIDASLPGETWASEADLGDALVITGHLSPEDLVRHLVAADVVSTLRFPSRGELSSVLVRAVGVGRPVLVTAGTPAAEEMPEGVVVPVDPGPRELDELVALLRLLLGSERFREEIGGVARAHALAHHRLETAVERLAGFLVEVQSRRAALLQHRAERAEEGTLTAYLVDEVHQAARDLGLEADRLGFESRLAPLATPAPSTPCGLPGGFRRPPSSS
jgi:glycosyltransferase involved in cell wall biosynthesis